MRKALLIAYHYPPVKISSGVQRTLAFSQYLEIYGWKPILLTVNPRAYPAISDDQLKDIPDTILIKRAFALDTAKHLSIGGRYLRLMAIPDRWVSWLIGGLFSGLALIRKHKPDVILSTYPIATAHLIGLVLSKLSGTPFIADFRDSMFDDTYPKQKGMRFIHRTIERWVINACRYAIFTTPGAVRLYRSRYPNISTGNFKLITNGYNEDIFREIESDLPSHKIDEVVKSDRLVLVHSGVIYPDERDPKYFFQAISELKRDNLVNGDDLQILLRATGHDDIYHKQLKKFAIDDIVHLMPGIDYRDALIEMMSSDGLIVLQGSSCNHQIPAKIYEYFRAKKPIIALTDRHGDTGVLLKQAGIITIADLNDVVAIKNTLLEFLVLINTNNASVATEDVIRRYSRRNITKDLADTFFDAIK